VTGRAFLDHLRAQGVTLRTRGSRLVAPAALPPDVFAAIERHRESLRLALDDLDDRPLLDDLTAEERTALGFEPMGFGVGPYRRTVWTHVRGDAYAAAVLMGDVPLATVLGDADAVAAWRRKYRPPHLEDPEVRPGRLPGQFVITMHRDRAYRPVSLD
jgi:hypothetical protein